MNTEDTDLRGLDYLTERQAARYACVSVSQFRGRAEEYGIIALRFMGRKVYRKVDIRRAIENEWQRSPRAVATGSSTGRIRPAGTAKASVA